MQYHGPQLCHAELLHRKERSCSDVVSVAESTPAANDVEHLTWTHHLNGPLTQIRWHFSIRVPPYVLCVLQRSVGMM